MAKVVASKHSVFWDEICIDRTVYGYQSLMNSERKFHSLLSGPDRDPKRKEVFSISYKGVDVIRQWRLRG